MNVLRVTLRESKHHEGACKANDPTYDNSELSDVVNDWGVFGLTSRFTGRYIRNIRKGTPNPGLVLDWSGLAKVTDRVKQAERRRLSLDSLVLCIFRPEWHLPHEVEDALAILVVGTNPITVRESSPLP
ncbi:hypothetical protein PIB30_070478 [Stylosanthes scabra]|uniref:Uncharacterized protein n=1 Tax=Stylosanthes scabra TaxID=79078 RepID=A0ABU6XLT2_9FABA|nr:hypothetical protein [Stylosanthes scabra]